MRILVVEDNVEFYQGYFLRILGNLVPMEKIEIEHVDSLEKGLLNLNLPWDMIVLDHSFPDNARFPVDNPEGKLVKDGADLAEMRRLFEMERGLKPAVIMAISSTQVGNRAIVAKGGQPTLHFLKLQVPEMAKAINAAMGAP